jgi:DNA-directed RNA polymerase sigma subunit (sigma70/sigma32)
MKKFVQSYDQPHGIDLAMLRPVRSCAAVGKLLGLTSQRVNQIQRVALRKVALRMRRGI